MPGGLTTPCGMCLCGLRRRQVPDPSTSIGVWARCGVVIRVVIRLVIKREFRPGLGSEIGPDEGPDQGLGRMKVQIRDQGRCWQ